MVKLIETILFATMLAFLPIPSFAGADSDSLATERKISKINASAFKMQKRYRPKDKTDYVKGGFFNDSYVSLSAGALTPIQSDYASGLVTYATFGKRFSPLHGMRLNLGFGRFYDLFQYNRIWDYSAYCSYLFNLTAYVHGYDESRPCNVYIQAGIGIEGIKSSIQYNATTGNITPGATLGLNVNFHLCRNFDFFFEPSIKITTDITSSPHSDNWHRYLLTFLPSAGISYRIQNPTPENIKPGKDWFVFACGGTLFQSSELSRQMMAKHRFGYYASAGVGRRCSDCLDIRGYASYSKYNWRYYNGLSPLGCTDLSVGADAFLDLFNLCSSKKVDWFAIGPIIGMFGGRMNKEYHIDPGIVCKYYMGGRIGLQTKFRVSKNFAIFMEGMDKIVPYYATNSDRNSNKLFSTYVDHIIVLNLGIEFHFSK